MSHESDIIATAFFETIAHYQKSPLVGARLVVTVLEEMLTRIEQDVASHRREAVKVSVVFSTAEQDTLWEGAMRSAPCEGEWMRIAEVSYLVAKVFHIYDPTSDAFTAHVLLTPLPEAWLSFLTGKGKD